MVKKRRAKVKKRRAKVKKRRAKVKKRRAKESIIKIFTFLKKRVIL